MSARSLHKRNHVHLLTDIPATLRLVTAYVAQGQLESLRTRSLTVKSRLAGTFSLPVHATSDPQEIGPVDLVLFCVKTYDTRAASEGLHLFMGPETVVLSIQNGINVAEQLSGEVGM